MILLTEDSLPPKPTSLGLLLTVALDGTHNRVRRTLLVPATAHLGWLHAVLQVAMGWTNSHLHQFTFKDKTFSDPSFELYDPLTLDESKGRLDTLLVRPGDLLQYQYDFGDSWEHTILLTSTAAIDHPTMARCIDGAGACPPEDCGGIIGFNDLLKAIKKPTSKAAQEFKDWLGYTYDPNAFCPTSADQALSKLAWPSVSEKQLARTIRTQTKTKHG
jgi:hypothetical protein